MINGFGRSWGRGKHDQNIFYEKMYSNVQFKNKITLLSACPLSHNLFLREFWMLAILSFIFTEEEQIYNEVCSLFLKGWNKLHPLIGKSCGPNQMKQFLKVQYLCNKRKTKIIYIISLNFFVLWLSLNSHMTTYFCTPRSGIILF